MRVCVQVAVAQDDHIIVPRYHASRIDVLRLCVCVCLERQCARWRLCIMVWARAFKSDDTDSNTASSDALCATLDCWTPQRSSCDGKSVLLISRLAAVCANWTRTQNSHTAIRQDIASAYAHSAVSDIFHRHKDLNRIVEIFRPEFVVRVCWRTERLWRKSWIWYQILCPAFPVIHS